MMVPAICSQCNDQDETAGDLRGGPMDLTKGLSPQKRGQQLPVKVSKLWNVFDTTMQVEKGHARNQSLT